MSLLAIVNDVEAAVEVVIDEGVWKAEMLKCHPLVNTSTLAIGRQDVERLLALTDHVVTLLEVPKRN